MAKSSLSMHKKLLNRTFMKNQVLGHPISLKKCLWTTIGLIYFALRNAINPYQTPWITSIKTRCINSLLTCFQCLSRTGFWPIQRGFHIKLQTPPRNSFNKKWTIQICCPLYPNSAIKVIFCHNLHINVCTLWF